MEAAAGSVQRQGRGARFAAAGGVLSQYVKAAAEARPAAVAVLPLMPGADVPGAHEEAEAETGPAPAPQQLTISYGGRVVVLEDVPADRAAELLRVAAAAQGAAPRALAAGDLPVARKASLQLFMEKRRGRTAARGSPYSRPDADGASPHLDHLALAL
ncbi:protein TIFY 11e-like [Panicum virgatum]|uniref:Protein TIFY n=1 Tax=Panicum virgatum TaxID=38727 RepID=A0A8T0NM14_PANVG|nr:protein TIFY 11e-like [Panicum virgatum]KAG2549319.1 hypothetical protein PVAP13_9KG268100 [Panicum virgatum]